MASLIWYTPARAVRVGEPSLAPQHCTYIGSRRGDVVDDVAELLLISRQHALASSPPASPAVSVAVLTAHTADTVTRTLPSGSPTSMPLVLAARTMSAAAVATAAAAAAALSSGGAGVRGELHAAATHGYPHNGRRHIPARAAIGTAAATPVSTRA